MNGAASSTPPRPHVPPLLAAGLVLWVTTALWWPITRSIEINVLAGVAVAGCAGAFLVLLIGLRRSEAPLALIVFLAFFVALIASSAAALALRDTTVGMVGSEGPWTCTLTTDAKASDFGFRADAHIVDATGASAEVRLYLPVEGEGMLQGERVRAMGTLKAPSALSVERFWEAGSVGTLSVSAYEELSPQNPLVYLRQRAIELVGSFGGREAPLVQALVCGWRPAIEEEGTYEQFKVVGLAHLVAVSGAHLSIVTMFIAQGLQLLRCSRRARAVVTALFLVGYVCFTGMPVSALRAAVMAATGLLALVCDRRSSALAALGGCIAVFVALDPPCALAASFVLSAGSTLGIVLLAPLFSAAFEPWPRRVRSLAGEPLALTAASACVTQPYAAALFSYIPLLSPIANVVGGPLFTLACVVGFIGVLAACVAPVAAPLAIGAAGVATMPLLWVVELLSQVPGSCMAVDAEVLPMVCIGTAATIVLWAWWPQLRPRAVMLGLAGPLVVALGTGIPALGSSVDEIVMLDVGQGDAFLLRSQGATLLIDTGNQDAMLKEACARQGVRRIDRVAVTHPDDDHCGSLEALGDVARVDGLIVADDLLQCPCDACEGLLDTAAREGYRQGVTGLELGDEVSCGRFRLRVVWPDAFTDEGGNADSLSFLCTWDGNGDGEAEWTALFCGDAEAEELRAMAPALPADGVDVLKVGHHGSKRSLDADLTRMLRPSIALIGVGENNRYGHPAPAVLEALTEVGAEVLCSDEAGDVSVAFSMEKLTVCSQNGPDAP